MFKWSYTSLNQFKTCPRQFAHQRILKTFKQAETDALRYGNAAHEIMEKRVRDKEPIPDQYPARWELIAQALEGKPQSEIEVEKQYGLGFNMEPLDYDDPNVVLRGKLDLTVVSPSGKMAMSRDYKTGKYKPELADEKTGQLKLASLYLFAHKPVLELVETYFDWLDVVTPPTKRVYPAEQKERLWIPFQQLIEEGEEAIETKCFEMRENWKCKRFCDELTCPKNGRR